MYCIFLEKFGCNLTYYESENFSDSSLHHIFESGSEMWKIKIKIKKKIRIKIKS